MTAIDVRLSTLAATRHGIVTLDDALGSGLSRQQVKGRIRSGRWERVGRGVFRINGVPQTWQQRALAACLAAPDGATASHLTAAALADLGERPPEPPHITVGLHRSVRSPTAVVHRARLGPVDYAVLQGVPTTTVARTLVDCAAVVGPRRLQKLVDRAFHLRLATPQQVAQAWDTARLGPGRAGEVDLRAAVDAWAGPVRPDSPAELRLERLLVDWGYPVPQRQVPVLDDSSRVVARLDLGWPELRIGVEYDGVESHGPSQWQHDEDRHRIVTDLGWTLLHADKADLLPGARRLQEHLARVWATRSPS